MIWATDADRAAIVAKVEAQPWAKSCFDAMKARVSDAVAAHQRDPDAYLRGLPLVPNKTNPERHPTLARIGDAADEEESSKGGRSKHSLQRYLHIGTDCSVLYYITRDETYARCAADILNAAIEAWSANTVKFRLEYYFEKVGNIAVSAYRRAFKNFFGNVTFKATPEFLALYDLDPSLYENDNVVTQYNLTSRVRMEGLDFEYKQALTFLPPWARGVQVFTNASAIRASGDGAANFAGFIPRNYSWGASLSRPKYSVKLNWNYRGEQRQGLISSNVANSIEPNTYNWANKRLYVDLTVDYQLTRRFAVFMNMRNLTDTPENYAIAGPNTPDLDRNPPFTRLMAQVEWIAQHEGRVHGFINWQGILNNAHRLRGEALLTDMLEEPKRARHLFGCVCETMTQGIRRLHERQRVSGVDLRFVTVSNCLVNLVSPALYRELLLPFDQRLAAVYGVIGIHNCAWSATPYLEAYAQVAGVAYIDMGLKSDLGRAKAVFPSARRALMYTPMDLANKPSALLRADFEQVARDYAPCDLVVADIEAGTPDVRVLEAVDLCRQFSAVASFLSSSQTTALDPGKF